MYDLMIVGAGLYGSTVARLAADQGRRVLVIDRRDHVAGNCHTRDVDGILQHVYGPHIFHTNSDAVWAFVNRFTKFNGFTLRNKATTGGRFYSLPINLNTFYQLWGVTTPAEASDRLGRERIPIARPANLEEWVLDQVGPTIYETLIRGYTTKQWGRDPRDLPASIIKRLPIRLTWDDNYFSARWQGIPIGGYTAMIRRMLEHDLIDVRLGEDFDRRSWKNCARRLIYSGCVDAFFGYSAGELEYRSLRFETARREGDVQGTAIVNYTDAAIPWTRQVEHKHFSGVSVPHSVVTREFPAAWDRSKEAYYPIADDRNLKVKAGYSELMRRCCDVVFGGRLATYRYWDMDQTIAAAIAQWSRIAKI